MFRLSRPALLFLFAGSLLAPPVLADKPDHAGGGKHWKNEGKHEEKSRGKQDHSDRDDRRESSLSLNLVFNDRQRSAVHEHYRSEFRGGHCPPGLAKKGNGCQPPGQAKKWQRGRALPRDVTYYPISDSLSVRIGLPPAGHRYVRVGTDLLLIAIGTRMVVDAIEDIGR